MAFQKSNFKKFQGPGVFSDIPKLIEVMPYRQSHAFANLNLDILEII